MLLSEKLNSLARRVHLQEAGFVNEWWKTFFDQDYFRIWGQLSSEEANAKQVADFWSMLDLTPGSSVLDAPPCVGVSVLSAELPFTVRVSQLRTHQPRGI